MMKPKAYYYPYSRDEDERESSGKIVLVPKSFFCLEKKFKEIFELTNMFWRLFVGDSLVLGTEDGIQMLQGRISTFCQLFFYWNFHLSSYQA